MLDFTDGTPYTGPAFSPTRSGPRDSGFIPPLNRRSEKRLRLSQADARIGGYGYADRDNCSPAHRQGIRVHP
jgi:hypothetical protein